MDRVLVCYTGEPVGKSSRGPGVLDAAGSQILFRDVSLEQFLGLRQKSWETYGRCHF